MPTVKMGEGGLTAVGPGFPTALQGSPWNIGGADGAPFVPADLGGLDLDLDPSNGVTKDGSNNVSQMVDQASGTEVYNAPGGNQPLWVDAVLGGKPIIRSAVDSWLENNSQIVTHRTEPHTVVSIFRASAVSYNVLFVLKANIGEGLLTLLSTDPSFGKIQQGSNSFAYLKSDGVPATLVNQWHVLYQTYNGSGGGTDSNFSFVIDGITPVLTPSSNVGAGNTKSVIGGWNTSGFGQNFQGDWARILKYGKVLTASEMAQLNTYFSGAYGV